MQFQELKDRLSKINNLPLPGEIVQWEMAPESRKTSVDEIEIEERKPRWAGVTGLFYPSEQQEAMLVLILRNTYRGVHSNQVGFPGGKREDYDDTLADTALRETEEEIGVDRESIYLVKKMTKIYIPPSNFWVQPYMGYVNYTPRFVGEDAEVAAIIEVKVRDFLAEESHVQHQVALKTSTIDVPAYSLNKYNVWGATAMMLSEMKNLLLEAK